ncbi:MAG: hypothetical protein R6V59_06255 [Dehalococcoidia bacterium]
MKNVNTLLIVTALLAGMIGCAPAQYNLTISSSEGGEVTSPGEGDFFYDEGRVVYLVAEAAEGYHLENWTGDVGTVADVSDSTTTITMNGGYSITANFSKNIYPYSGSTRLHPGVNSSEYTWFSFVPDDVRRSSTYYILLTAEGGNPDYGSTIENVEGSTTLFRGTQLFSNLIYIGVAIPRGEGWRGEYAVAMPASVFSDDIDKKFYRPDLKVSAIIEDFTSELESYGIEIHDKVLIWGFSNSAMFAQRYCFLHPEKVKAVSIGQAGGALTMGMDTYSNNELDWPVGINDYGNLTSVDFNANAYNSIPKFIFIGEDDTGPYQSTVYSPVYGWNTEIFTVEQCQILYDIADTDPTRVQNQSAIMNDNGDNITFKMYPEIGHVFSWQMLSDAGAFFTDIINK